MRRKLSVKLAFLTVESSIFCPIEKLTIGENCNWLPKECISAWLQHEVRFLQRFSDDCHKTQTEVILSGQYHSNKRK